MSRDIVTESYTLPPAAPHHNEGRTPAAWVMAGGVSLGLLIAVIGFAIASTILLVFGIVVIAGSLLASFGMRKAGRGQPLEDVRRRDWYDR